jgi:hypothetical protein
MHDFYGNLAFKFRVGRLKNCRHAALTEQFINAILCNCPADYPSIRHDNSLNLSAFVTFSIDDSPQPRTHHVHWFAARGI